MDTEPVAPAGANDPPTVQILLVDEHLIFREGLRKLLEAERGFTVVGDASGPDDGQRAVEEQKPDIVIVSLTGRWLARLLQTLHDLPRILQAIRARGLHTVTVPELLAADPPSISQLRSGICH